jgi:hypothetical protein
MNFEMSDDRRMLADTLRRALGDGYGFEHRTRVAYEAPFHDPAQWTRCRSLACSTPSPMRTLAAWADRASTSRSCSRNWAARCAPNRVLPALMAIRALGASEDVLSAPPLRRGIR